LNEQLRNVFMHFIPSGLSMAMADVRPLGKDCLDAVLHLALRTGTVVHLNETQQKQVTSLVSDGKLLLEQTAPA